MDLLENTFAQILEAYSKYAGSGVYITLFYTSILYMYMNRRKNEANNLLFQYSLISLIIIMNPLTGYIIIRAIEDFVYWRVFWILPVTIAIAYAATEVIVDTSGKLKKVVVSIALAAILIMGGKFIYTSENYSEADNWYKLPSQTLDVCEILKGDTDGVIRAVVPAELLVSIRQYDADIQLLYGRDGRVNTYDDTYKKKRNVYSLMSESEINSKAISIYMKDLECNYLVLLKTTKLSRSLGRYGYQYVASTYSYDIYRLT